MTVLVLLRHGQSVWNREDRFTGWVDVDLTEAGVAEAERAGDALRANGFDFDVCYTSVLKRAVRTLWIALDRMDRMWLPVIRDWRLNERHYGGLTGLNKQEMRELHGEKQVHIWRRSFDAPPPALGRDDSRWKEQAADRRYADVPGGVPACETLKLTIERVRPCWDAEIAPRVARGDRVLISAHGNSLRALIKHLEGISDEDIPSFEIATGRPRIYQLGDDLKPVNVFDLD